MYFQPHTKTTTTTTTTKTNRENNEKGKENEITFIDREEKISILYYVDLC